jgi:hypothetical protein
MRRHILVTLLTSLGLISEGAAQQGPSPYTRLILPAENATPQYKLLKFTNFTDACNFYGNPSKECTFANEYFKDWKGSYTATLEFARFPTESTRAHIYGGGGVAARYPTPAELAAALDAGTTRLNVPLNGVTLTACFGTGVGCTNLAGLTTYKQIASAVQSALNASPVTLGTITGTITPASVPINITIEREKTAFQVNSVEGTLYTGAYVCAASTPCLSNSSDLIGQIANEMIWAPETVRDGPGWYGFLGNPTKAGFHMSHLKETIPAVASYGVLKVISNDSGSKIAAPMGISRGGVHIGYVWECMSQCGQNGAKWILNKAATVSTPETMDLTSVQVGVVWNGRANGPTAWGYFDVAQVGDAQPTGVDTIGYATGSAALILGLSEGSPPYPGIPNSEAFASSPGHTVRNIGGWLDKFRASGDSSWTSCEIDYSARGEPDTLANEIQDWAMKQQPPIQCPASWVTTPPSTPSLLSCLHHDPSCPPQ